MFKLLAWLEIYIPRLLAPFVLYWNPIAGIALIIYLDVIDMRLLKGLGRNLKGYNRLDKTLDFFNNLLVLIYATQFFPATVSLILGGLFMIRTLGIVDFLINRNRRSLFYFPNVFFSFFVLYTLLANVWTINLIFAVSFIFQVIFEYIHHVSKLSSSEEYLQEHNDTVFMHKITHLL